MLTPPFFIIFYQLFEFYPNFSEDWIDTSSIIASLKHGIFDLLTSRGLDPPQEEVINAGALVPVSLEHLRSHTDHQSAEQLNTARELRQHHS
ncbi:hypothetical protein [Pajaroellobacter abortibovis]|uniref:hypothetical protein n=1 Tax=Pajaroellobacter abortibovis TaxID=1882918 RepID=UPI0012EB53DA|nr:hypothetical protein [Pajaroellobacter abortibovis]